MYKLIKNIYGGESKAVMRLTDSASIPFDPDNTDYINFKKDIAEETAELQDADGNVMSPEEAKSYIATLPA